MQENAPLIKINSDYIELPDIRYDRIINRYTYLQQQLQELMNFVASIKQGRDLKEFDSSELGAENKDSLENIELDLLNYLTILKTTLDSYNTLEDIHKTHQAVKTYREWKSLIQAVLPTTNNEFTRSKQLKKIENFTNFCLDKSLENKMAHPSFSVKCLRAAIFVGLALVWFIGMLAIGALAMGIALLCIHALPLIATAPTLAAVSAPVAAAISVVIGFSLSTVCAELTVDNFVVKNSEKATRKVLRRYPSGAEKNCYASANRLQDWVKSRSLLITHYPRTAEAIIPSTSSAMAL